MRKYLVFQLYGPLAAWGDIAVGQSRHSHAYPSKSAVMGMVASALGIRREEERIHQELFSSYGFAVKVLSMGTLMQDFHTTQVPPEQRNKRYFTRKEELNSEKLGTGLSTREYRCDALSVVGFWSFKDKPLYSMEQLTEALNRPRFVLYLGRKSCPLSLPVRARSSNFISLKEALDSVEPIENIDLLQYPHYHWDDTDEAGMDKTHSVYRHDVCISQKRRQFEPREENVLIGQEAGNVF